MAFLFVSIPALSVQGHLSLLTVSEKHTKESQPNGHHHTERADLTEGTGAASLPLSGGPVEEGNSQTGNVYRATESARINTRETW